jgi:hypothetical protein
MTIQIYIVFFLTFVIYTIGTLAYSVRIVGIRTGKIAVAGAVFNIFVLIQRMAGGFQAPFLAKTIETSINSGNTGGLLLKFRLILSVTAAAIVFGAVLMPTFIKIFTKLVNSFSIYKSIPKVLIHGFSKSGIEQFKKSITAPKKENIAQLKHFKKMPKKIIVLNVIASSISITGGMAAMYAGALIPQYRTTCTTLSSCITGISTIMIYMFIDPYLSMLVDDVVRGECPSVFFNRCIIFIVCGLACGALLAQALFIPVSSLIVEIAKII